MAHDKREALMQTFKSFDRNNDGIIGRTELADVIREIRPPDSELVWDDEEINMLLKVIDKNRDGKIQYEEFVAWMFGESLGDTGRISKQASQANKGRRKKNDSDSDSEDSDEEDEESEDEDEFEERMAIAKVARNLAHNQLMPELEGSARAASKAMNKLPAPNKKRPGDTKHAELYVRNFPGADRDVDGEPPPGANRERALRWLHAALTCVSEGDKRYFLPARFLLGNWRLWPDNEDGDEEGFVELKEFAIRKLDDIGIHYEKNIFDALELGKKLGSVGAELPPARPRQDKFLKWEDSLEPDEEYVDTAYTALLMTAAHAIDPVYQAAARQICEAAGGDCKSPAPKGFMRMMAKLETDHAQAVSPKPAENIDTNRIAWTFEEPSQLRDAYDRARAAFGEPLRIKNGYDPKFHALDISKGYRNILANYHFAPKGLTWGDLMSRKETIANLADLRSKILQIFQKMGFVDEASLDDIRTKWFHAFETMADHLGSYSMHNAPVELIVEVQYMLQPYMDMRKKTHAWYKIVRAETAEGLVLDYQSS